MRIVLYVAAALLGVSFTAPAPAMALPSAGQLACAAADCSLARQEGLVRQVASRGSRGSSFYRSSGHRSSGYRASRGSGSYYRSSGRYSRSPAYRSNRGWNRHARHAYRHRGHHNHHRHYGYGRGFYYPSFYYPYPSAYAYDPYDYGYGYGYGDDYGISAEVQGSVGDGDYVRYCSRKHRSFNRRTGRYRTYSGHYKRCVYRG